MRIFSILFIILTYLKKNKNIYILNLFIEITIVIINYLYAQAKTTQRYPKLFKSINNLFKLKICDVTI